MNPSSVLSVRELHKSYGPHRGVEGVSFEVRPGEIVGLLGPNGAGKTTTMECIEGLRTPDAGAIELRAGPRAAPLGVQLQAGALPQDLHVVEALRLFCAYRRVAPRFDLLERFGLGAVQGRRVGELSVGNQRRLALALAIAHRPALVLLDEPTAGLDVASRATLHELMREEARDGTAVLIATHDMAEAEKLADRVCILLRGRIVAQGTPRELTREGDDTTHVVVATVQGTFASGAVALDAAALTGLDDGYAQYRSTDAAATVAHLLAQLREHGDRLTDLRVQRPNLEERFLALTTGGAS